MTAPLDAPADTAELIDGMVVLSGRFRRYTHVQRFPPEDLPKWVQAYRRLRDRHPEGSKATGPGPWAKHYRHTVAALEALAARHGIPLTAPRKS